MFTRAFVATVTAPPPLYLSGRREQEIGSTEKELKRDRKKTAGSHTWIFVNYCITSLRLSSKVNEGKMKGEP